MQSGGVIRTQALAHTDSWIINTAILYKVAKHDDKTIIVVHDVDLIKLLHQSHSHNHSIIFTIQNKAIKRICFIHRH